MHRTRISTALIAFKRPLVECCSLHYARQHFGEKRLNVVIRRHYSVCLDNLILLCFRTMQFYFKWIFLFLSASLSCSSITSFTRIPTLSTRNVTSTVRRLLLNTNDWKSNVNVYTDWDDADILEPILEPRKISTFRIIILSDSSSTMNRNSTAPALLPVQRHSTIGSFNFVILGGTQIPVFLKTIKSTQPNFHPSMDKTLFYQWRNYDPALLYRKELAHFKYVTELLENGNEELSYNLLCFYCDRGNPKFITHRSDEVLELSQLFPDWTKNFHGRKLRYSTSQKNPILVNFRLTNGIWEYYGGVSTPILDALKRFLNCTISTHPDEEYGNELPNGSFSGVIGKLARDEYDIGVLAQHYNRFRVAYFSHLIVTGNVVLSTRLPVKSSSFNAFQPRAFFLLFGISFGVILPVYMALLKITSWAEKPTSFKSMLGRGISFIYIPLFEQELPESAVPRSTSLKILFAFWLCFTLIISTAYKSKLLDLMIQGSPEYLPTTFDELAELSHYEVVARGFGGALTATLKAIQTPTFSNIVKRMRTTDVTSECIGNAIRKEYAVCICYREILELVSCRNYTDKSGKKMLQISPEPKSAFYLHGCVATRKDAVYKETIDRVVHLVYASFLPQYGVVQDFRQAESDGRTWARLRDDSEYESMGDDGTRKPLKIKHFKQILTLLFVALGLSTLVFLIEFAGRLWGWSKF